MFEKKKSDIPYSVSSAQSIETIIGEGASFEGTITTRTALRIDGHVKGDIKSTGTVIIGQTGSVEGTVAAMDTFIAGTINGNVTTDGKTEFVAGGFLKGDLNTGLLIIEQGASFEGNCKTKVTDAVKNLPGDSSAKIPEKSSGIVKVS